MDTWGLYQNYDFELVARHSGLHMAVVIAAFQARQIARHTPDPDTGEVFYLPNEARPTDHELQSLYADLWLFIGYLRQRGYKQVCSILIRTLAHAIDYYVPF